MWSFSDFQHGIKSSHSTVGLLTIAMAFKSSRATWAVALDISQAFNRVWHAGHLHKLIKSYEISNQIFRLISSFLSIRQLQVVLDGKTSQYPVNAGVAQGPILGPSLLVLYINDLPCDIICNIAICADDTTLYSKCDQASDQWQQLELAFEVECYLQDTVVVV